MSDEPEIDDKLMRSDRLWLDAVRDMTIYRLDDRQPRAPRFQGKKDQAAIDLSELANETPEEEEEDPFEFGD